MKELFTLIFKLDFKNLFFTPTENGLIKFFRYAFVGGIAFVFDYLFSALFYSIFKASVSKDAAVAIGTTAGFIAGIIINFILSKKFVFTEDSSVTGKKGEFVVYTIIGIIGYGLNILLMLIATKWINFYIAKIIVALIVLVYNYLARKTILYK